MRRRAAVIISLAIAAAATGTLVLTTGIPSSTCANSPEAIRTFTIVGDLNGFNGSRTHTPPWPIMSVQRCDTVVIRFMNQDSQAHGLAVEFYSNSGITPQGGQTLELRFLATRTGQFKVFCHIFCTVHNYMQQGLLNVT